MPETVVTCDPGQGMACLSLDARPLSFYRITAETRCAGPGYWFADFFDGAGAKNYADNYSSTYASDEWIPLESVFFSRAETVRIFQWNHHRR